MGSYTFTWDHPAQEVYVTGDFDNWSKSIKLNKNGDSFHKTVTIPGEEHRVHYKFVVDGQWTTDWTAKQETDSSGNVNNVVEARELSPEPEERPAQAFISSVHPQSTTAALAGEVPLEKERNAHSEQSVDETTFPQETPGFEDLPGQFPVTPMADLKQFTVNPIPATDGPSNPVKLAPGEPVPHPSTLTSNTIQSTEKEDTKAFGINPIPATAGIGNPIKLAPGEPVPHHSKITSNTIQSTVRDGSQYGVSDTGAPVLPPVLDSQSEAEANGASMFNLPSIGGNMIPESSLPMGGDSQLPNFDNAFSSSVAPQSTTAQLAGQVPREPRGVPEVVSESQESAHVSPEASSSAKAVQSKHDVEEELKEKVPEANASAESGPTVSNSHVPEAVAGGLAAAGATAIGAALLAKDKISEAYTHATEPTPASKQVPDVVTESQERAHVEPEASASPEVVREKAAFEDELKHSIPEAPATSESGLLGASEGVVTESQERAHVQPEASASPEAVREKTAMEGELLSEVSKAPATSESGILGKSEQGITDKATAGQVPEVVHESQERAHVDPEASANPEAVHEKHDMESELLSHVHKAPATSESGVAIDNMNQGLPPTNSSLASPATHSSVPEAVLDSQHQAHVGPEASAQPEVVAEKSDVERELLDRVPRTDEAGEPAPTESAALSATAPVKPTSDIESAVLGAGAGAAQIPAPKSEQLAAPTLAAPTEQSRDVSPMTRPDSSKQSEPQVTTGTETHTVPATTGSAPTTPQRHATKRSSGFFRGTPQSDRTSVAGSSKVDEDGKPKKKGFLAKLKEKFRG
ncbi:hypothetical protein M438DRAFT_271056 [Aureobasidium pullulans EXF-150]|uniref:AMP-activated protein kinase glycogen-binding domain-containing protein n=1 Tax=Aureobasidium pullulans EXF-150 TaxID=1043002 RepID=A0A074YGE8_AURPU|nr:uncharacterized protein M438DRAFT_271056 [Aureobasidium pullulans EXF-150]KEQ85946.1 hypothetical protein M438DRAFT_271056 [Aureobasidium pullulans EXF-150]